MRYLLSSAVLTAFGRWDYAPLTPKEATAWLQASGWQSTIGYAETATALEQLCGLAQGTIPVDRRTITMQGGDEALVFRLTWPHGTRPDAVTKGGVGLAFITAHSELGLLRRLA